MADNIKYRFIQNVGDYFPSGYFSEDFIDKVQKAAGVSSDEMADLCTPYVALRREYEAYKNYIVNTNPRVKDAIKHTHDFNNRLLKILGYDAEETYTFLSVSDDASSVVPVRQVLHRGGNTSMLIMEMQHLIKVGDNEPGGLFVQQYNVDGNTATVRHQQFYAGQWSEVFTVPDDAHISPAVINKAIDALFLLPKERRPHYILMLAGNTLFMLDEEKWNRGAYLVFSLDELFSQASIPTFRKYYALFHLLLCKDTLAADSETVLMDKLVEESYKNAYEVTKDLKVGVVDSVETLANEALHWWQQNGSLPVADYTDDTFEAKVKDDCLTIVYRLLFIFYAESRDELDILPTHDEVYDEGYSLEMLRDLEKVPLISEAARNGFFIHESLSHLFALLSTGYHDKGNKSFSVRHIDSPLFDDDRLNYFKGVKFRNVAWQQIIRSLSLSNTGRQVGRISYANLGINQLGSVYESLLAYRGFYAEEDYIEVHKADHPEDGTFLVPYSRMDDFEANEILSDADEKPIILKQGTFVYRLNGRDRQKSASYYTPEVLTRSTVKYTLKTILDEVREGKRQAQDLLDLKILEPAMGAAAFQNEVVNQLAEAYLQYRQEEKHRDGVSTWHIAPDHYRDELQKVKAYIATHNVYGVDLNPTAIELGKLSLWLNVIHKDMETPFFSNRLALGNAVIGAWLKCYNKSEVVAKPKPHGKGLIPTKWWEKAPHKISFNKNSVHRSVNEVYHFLLPDEGMLAVRTIKDYKDKAREENSDSENRTKPTYHALQAMKARIAEWTAPLGEADFPKLQRLSQKIDVLLKEYFRFQQSVENLTQNKVNLWGVSGVPVLNLDSYAEKERLNDVRYRHDNAYFRLKMVMDYWCALWFWPLEKADQLPSREDYWRDIDAMLNVSDEQLNARTAHRLRQGVYVDSKGQMGLFPQYHQNDIFMEMELENMVQEPEQVENDLSAEQESDIIRMSKEEILTEVHGERTSFFDESLRFKIVKELSDRYHFFHPMLEFLEVFWLRDGFDIICGNPPFLKWRFEAKDIIADKYPEVVIRDGYDAPKLQPKIKSFLENTTMYELYYSEMVEVACMTKLLNSECLYSVLKGQQTDLFKCIIANSLQMQNPVGYMGLIHPNEIFDEVKGQILRKYIYPRLIFRFQYQNTLKIFSEVEEKKIFDCVIFGGAGKDSIAFDSINNIFHPSTIDSCYLHDGAGICNGKELVDENGKRHPNLLGHKNRIIHYDENMLKFVSRIFEDGADWNSCCLISIHSSDVVDIIKDMDSKTHVSNKSNFVTVAFDATNAVKDKTIIKQTCYPVIDKYQMIFYSAQINILSPFFMAPHADCLANYTKMDSVNYETISSEFEVRTNYVPGIDIDKFKRQIDESGIWFDSYKLGFRKMLDQITSERTLRGAILPPKTSHTNSIISVSFKEESDMLLFAGLSSSIVFDFFIRINAAKNLTPSRLLSFPFPDVNDKIRKAIVVRVLRLNCVNVWYKDLWQRNFEDAFKFEDWSSVNNSLPEYSRLSNEYNQDVLIRNEFSRRLALIELDVLTAFSFGISFKNFIFINRNYFQIAQKFDDTTWYDIKGNIVFSLRTYELDLDRNIWEDIRGEEIKDADGRIVGYKGTAPTYVHTIDPKKSELYGGQQVTYYAPYTRCDRIADYRRAWAFFEKRFKDQKDC